MFSTCTTARTLRNGVGAVTALTPDHFFRSSDRSKTDLIQVAAHPTMTKTGKMLQNFFRPALRDLRMHHGHGKQNQGQK
jgi:hypothetical protein